MVEAIEHHGWDGEWFLRAYDYFGNVVGSKTNDEGKIFAEPQGMCVMAGVGFEDGRAARRWRASETSLRPSTASCSSSLHLPAPPRAG